MGAPIEPAYHAKMNALAQSLDETFNGPRVLRAGPPKVGFCLLVFPLGGQPDARINYISNSERADMIAGLREFLARAEGRMTDQAGNA